MRYSSVTNYQAPADPCDIPGSLSLPSLNRFLEGKAEARVEGTFLRSRSRVGWRVTRSIPDPQQVHVSTSMPFLKPALKKGFEICPVIVVWGTCPGVGRWPGTVIRMGRSQAKLQPRKTHRLNSAYKEQRVRLSRCWGQPRPTDRFLLSDLPLTGCVAWGQTPSTSSLSQVSFLTCQVMTIVHFY